MPPPHKSLARRLVAASSESRRRRVAAAIQTVEYARAVGRAIKDICYASWTTEPASARRAAAALTSLAAGFDDRELDAVAAWISGIADLTRGAFDSAVDRFDDAARLFKRAGLVRDAAQTQVPKLIALAMPGKYAEALRAGRRLLRTFERLGDDLAAAKIELNLSNIAARREDHRAAERFCLSARERFKRIGETEWQAMAENGLANTYSELNDFRRADEYFALALATARRAGMTVTEAEIEASMGNLALFRGDHAAALRLLEASRLKFEKLGMPHQTAIAALEIADIYGELNLLDEAFALAAPLAKKLKKLRLPAEEARARLRAADSAARLSRRTIAAREIAQASEIFARERNRLGQARARLRAAELALTAGRLEEADAEIRKVRRILGAGGRLGERLTAEWLQCELDISRGKTSAAAKKLEHLAASARHNGQLAIEAAAAASLGEIELAAGRRDDARRSFEAAAAAVEALSSGLAVERARMSIVAGRLKPIERLAEIAIEEGRVDDALEITERARSRVLLDAMDARAPRRGSRELDSEIAAVRERLNWSYARLDRRSDRAQDDKLERDIRKLERELADLERRSASLAVSGTSSSSRRRFSIAALRKRLDSRDLALVEYVASGETGEVSAFVVASGKVRHIRLGVGLAAVDELLQKLRFQFSTLRYGAAGLGPFIPELKRRTDAVLLQIYEMLVAPLEPALGERDLLVVPAASLHYIPFPALRRGDGEYLIERRSLRLAPSAAVWMRLDERQRRPALGEKALFVGCADDAIPLAETEAAHLSKAFAGSDLLAGGAATVASVERLVPRASLLHFACHGQFRVDNPMFSNLRLADGWITVNDLARQRIAAELVTLSGCETGLSEVFAGEELLGLARGFLSAGASSLVVSLWTVNDASTERLMKLFYRGLQRGLAPAASLREAQHEFIRRDEHPYFWSPFVAIGK
ncbi:MAG: CHAT domain-containing protein [Pyrinomonadaceae bacterium]